MPWVASLKYSTLVCSVSDGEEDLSEKKAAKSWFSRRVEGEARSDSLSFSKRAGEVASFILLSVIAWFWVTHETSSTGFFTSEFGQAESFLFYLSVLFGLVPAVGRFLVGRKNAVRPLTVLQMVLSIVAVLWLLWVFPFNFSHLADVLPDSLRFLLQWITDDIARVLMYIAIFATPIGAVWNAVVYVSVRRELSKP